MRPIITITTFLFFVAWLGLIDYYDSLPEPGTDTGVSCIDDCLEVIDTHDDAEPIRDDQETP